MHEPQFRNVREALLVKSIYYIFSKGFIIKSQIFHKKADLLLQLQYFWLNDFMEKIYLYFIIYVSSYVINKLNWIDDYFD